MGGGVADELIDDLAHMNDLDLTWGFDLDAFLRERAQQAPDVGEAGGRTSVSYTHLTLPTICSV